MNGKRVVTSSSFCSGPRNILEPLFHCMESYTSPQTCGPLSGFQVLLGLILFLLRV